MTEEGAATSGSETFRDPLFRGSFLGGRRTFFKEEQRSILEAWVEDMEEDDRSEMPPLQIVMFPDLVEKAWGWERLLPFPGGIDRSDYSKYVQAYHKKNAPEHDAGTAAATGSTLVAMAKRCLKKEDQLASQLEFHTDEILLKKHIVLSSLVKECAHSVILKERVESSAAFFIAAFVCIEKEADLVLELLKRGAHIDDCLIKQSTEIRMCVLGLMGHSDIAAGAMLGIAKEASIMCEWMSKNQKLLDMLCSYLPDHLEEGRKIRFRTLEFMVSILTMPYTPAAAAVLKTVMEATDISGDEASDKLNRQDQKKIIDADNSKKRKRIEETKKEIIEGCSSSWLTKYSRLDGVSHCSCCSRIKSESERVEAGTVTSGSVTVMAYLSDRPISKIEALNLDSMVHAPHLGHGDTVDCEKTISLMWPAKCPEVLVEKTWGFSRLLPFNGSVKWSDYINYLCEYYKRLAPEFLREVASNQYPEVDPADRAGNLRAAADFCLKMEERLLSEWRILLSSDLDYKLPINTIIESSLIRDCAHSSFCTTGEEFYVASTIAFVCIALEADLMCKLLKHGTEPTDDIIEQSSVIRLCALSLLNLKGDQSVLAAAAMVGIAKEAKMICDWIKKEKKLVNFSSSTPHELEGSRFIRIGSLDVMTTIVKSSFSSSEMEYVAMAEKSK